MLRKMNSRADIKEREWAYLKDEHNKYPDLFSGHTFVEDPKTLARFGIVIPGQDTLPIGYLKLWPQDFIVEEIGKDGEIFIADDEETEQQTAPGESVHATLVKSNYSTIEAIKELALGLSCGEEQIHYAGIKDKDALTAQQISFRGIPLEAIQKFSSRHFFLKNIYQGKGAVEKGSLQGNRFTIFVRTFSPVDREVFQKRLEEISKNGFYNFYYLQRFGTPRLINYQWGMSILKGNYRQAVLDSLTLPGERELPYFKKLRQKIETLGENWVELAKLLEPFPLMCETENRLVRYLLEHPDDYAGALREIKEQTMLWVYAVSSLFFNRLLSSFIEKRIPLPAELPLLLSRDPHDWTLYTELLTQNNLIPLPLHNLRPFPFIQLRHRTAPTKDKVVIEKYDILNDGVALQFRLSKGSYATTFLSHLFQLASGIPPQEIKTDAHDLKQILNHGPNGALSYLAEVLQPKSRSVWGEFSLDS